MSISLKSFEGIIDFKGQRTSLLVFRVASIISAIVAFGVGFYRESLFELWVVFAGGIVFSLLLTLFPLPYLNQHPVKWLPSNQPLVNGKVEEEEEEDEEEEDEEEEEDKINEKR